MSLQQHLKTSLLGVPFRLPDILLMEALRVCERGTCMNVSLKMCVCVCVCGVMEIIMRV